VDIASISIVLLIGMLVLLGIGMPLGFASGFLATLVLVLKFEHADNRPLRTRLSSCRVEGRGGHVDKDLW